jgi:glycosyltransferase involved in cell wall biosynthesis
MEKILIITEAWKPQVSGVVSTFENLLKHIKDYKVDVLHPYVKGAKYYPVKPYEKVKILFNAKKLLKKKFAKSKPDHVYIVNEGPLGITARRFCIDKKIPFSTGYHSRWDIQFNYWAKLPIGFTQRVLRWFHSKSKNVLVGTESLAEDLINRGYNNVRVWGRGIDTKIFKPKQSIKKKIKEPTAVLVSRASKEKRIDDFCKLKGYKKIFVGGGPELNRLKRLYKDVEFTGYVENNKVPDQLNRAHVFPFPSRFDTFGVVMLEAMACGLPVAGYPVPGPQDVVKDKVTGRIGEDLQKATDYCYKHRKHLAKKCIAFAKKHTWVKRAKEFVEIITS